MIQSMGQSLAAVDVTRENRGEPLRDLRAGYVVLTFFKSEIAWTNFCSLKGLMYAQKVYIGLVLKVVGLMKEGLEIPFDFPSEWEPG